jgi:hypothetical protein
MGYVESGKESLWVEPKTGMATAMRKAKETA